MTNTYYIIWIILWEVTNIGQLIFNLADGPRATARTKRAGPTVHSAPYTDLILYSIMFLTPCCLTCWLFSTGPGGEAVSCNTFSHSVRNNAEKIKTRRCLTGPRVQRDLDCHNPLWWPGVTWSLPQIGLLWVGRFNDKKIHWLNAPNV